MKDAKTFIEAGNAIFTLKSLKSGKHFTFRARRASNENTFYISVLRGHDNTHDYSYLGYLHNELFHRGKSKIGRDAPSVLAFEFFWNRINNTQIPEMLEVWHEGKCGRCGRLLTEPESLKRGIGPVCAGY